MTLLPEIKPGNTWMELWKSRYRTKTRNEAFLGVAKHLRQSSVLLFYKNKILYVVNDHPGSFSTICFTFLLLIDLKSLFESHC